MEDLLAFLAFVVFAGISIISKIVAAKKKQDKLTGALKPVTKKRQAPPPKPVKQKVRQNLQQYSVKPVAAQPEQKQQPKKSLIQEEPVPVTQPEPELVSELIPPLPVETSASSYLSIADSLKANRKFAIICHEILGKPKALED
jgi:hypothetical protein